MADMLSKSYFETTGDSSYSVGEVVVAAFARAGVSLEWTPRVTFAELVEMMVDSDLQPQKRERYQKTAATRYQVPLSRRRF